MPCYRGTLTIVREQNYDFEVEAVSPEEALVVMSSDEYWEDKEDLAVNDWDSDVETLSHGFTDLEEIDRCRQPGER